MVGIMTEGGAVGHLSHLYDNLELTFGEIKDVIDSAASGKLEKVSEKLDGMNLVFTFDVSEDRLKVARAAGDIKRGGMDAGELAKKFFGRGNVEIAFNSAFQVLSDSLKAIPGKVKAKVFGPRANRWYSIEVIYTQNPGTVNYDNNNIVFHGWPIFQVTRSGEITQAEDDIGVQLLSSRIEQMQKAVSLKDWKIRGPSMLSLKKMSDGSAKNAAISRISSAMQDAGVSDNDTVYDYLRVLMGEAASELDVPEEVIDMVIARSIEAPDAPGIPEIKRVCPKESQQQVLEFIKGAETLKKGMVSPIESAISDFAIEVLRGLKSTLIDRSDDEVMRLRSQVTKAIAAIESSGNEAAMAVLQKEMARLQNVENIAAAMEGVVFFYKGQAYKFTGAFAPAHQIVSLFKYGRKGIPKMDMGESLANAKVGSILNSWSTVVDTQED